MYTRLMRSPELNVPSVVSGSRLRIAENTFQSTATRNYLECWCSVLAPAESENSPRSTTQPKHLSRPVADGQHVVM